MGTYQYYLTVDSYARIIKWFDPEYYGYDPIIKNYGPQHLDTILSTVKEWQISHRVKSAVAQTSSQILVYYKDPWVDGFILNTPGLTNYRGFIEADPTIKADDEFYG